MAEVIARNQTTRSFIKKPDGGEFPAVFVLRYGCWFVDTTHCIVKATPVFGVFVMSIEFFLTSLVVVLLPGTGVIYTLAIGLERGSMASVAAAFGCTLGIVPAAFASIVGLSALLHTSALAFQVIKFLGVLYLFYMAWTIVRDESKIDLGASKPVRSYRSIALTGTLINVLNPKLSLFFLAFLPQFTTPNVTNVTGELVGLAAVFMAMTFVVFIAYGAFASLAREYVIARPRVMTWIKRAFAGSFGLLGIKLAVSD